MATQANLQAMAVAVYESMEINVLYLKILFVLSAVGMIIDSYSESKKKVIP